MSPAAAAVLPSHNAPAELRELELDDILAEGNIRSFNTDDERWKGLRDSVRSMGVLQPVLVTPIAKPKLNGERFRLVAGFRRYAAACESGVSKIPARVLRLTGPQLILAQLTENVQRLDASPIEEAKAIASYLELSNSSQDALALSLGKSGAWVSNRLRLLRFPDQVQTWIHEGKISGSDALVLLRLPESDAAFVLDLAKQLVGGRHGKFGVTERVSARLYKLAGGRGDAPKISCGDSCGCTCRCCIARRS
ncbi:MAG TPA: ParB/RepB/Spo0J family partition protein [Thermoplasmata archaeon]|nr:ParB/RepB/Spo0J family partition protein [Thermoplasmata archaeon]